MKKDKRRKRNKGKEQIEQNKRETKTIEVNVGFTILKIVVTLLIVSLLTAKTVMTIIGTKENVAETEQEGIALLAEIDIGYVLSDDETYVTVTITSDYAITQIEVSEEDYDENLEEEDYTFTIEKDWEVADNGLVWSKEFTENLDKAYRLTFEDETSVVEEVIIEDFLESEEEEAVVTSMTDEDGNVNYDDEVQTVANKAYIDYATTYGYDTNSLLEGVSSWTETTWTGMNMQITVFPNTEEPERVCP